MSEYHLSLSIGKSLWNDLVGGALPMQVSQGAFDLGKAVYKGVKQLQVREKVSALIEQKGQNTGLVKAKTRVSELWSQNKHQVYKLIDELVHIEGDWSVHIDDKGTDFHYAEQKIGVDAHVKAIVKGNLVLLKNNIEIPFEINKRLGASCHLGDIRFDQNQNAVLGTVQEPAIHLGESAILQLVSEAASKLLEQQVDRFDKIPLIKKDQLDDMLAPSGGSLNFNMSVEDVRIEVSQSDLSLKVRFGFNQKQLKG